MDASHMRPFEAEYDVADASAETFFRHKPDGALDPAGEAGWFLQRERERLGLTLEEVSEATGIHPYHLDAFEQGDLTHMPNRADALNMVGYYAHYLGFDPEPLIHHYASILPHQAAAAENTHPANPAPLSSALILKFGSFPKLPKFDFKIETFPGGTGGVVASLMVTVAIFAGISWVMLEPRLPQPVDQVVQTQTTTPGEGTAQGVQAMQPATGTDQTAEVEYPPLPPTPQAMPEAGDQTAASEPAPSATTEAPPQQQPVDEITAFLQQDGGGTEAKSADGKMTVSPEATATIEPSQKMNEAKAGDAGDETSRLTLKARGPVWVRIEDSMGNVVMTQMLMAGDTYKVPKREGLVVIARDGGLLSYLIDGKEKGILGPPGEILVGKSLDLKNLGQPG